MLFFCWYSHLLMLFFVDALLRSCRINSVILIHLCSALLTPGEFHVNIMSWEWSFHFRFTLRRHTNAGDIHYRKHLSNPKPWTNQFYSLRKHAKRAGLSVIYRLILSLSSILNRLVVYTSRNIYFFPQQISLLKACKLKTCVSKNTLRWSWFLMKSFSYLVDHAVVKMSALIIAFQIRTSLNIFLYQILVKYFYDNTYKVNVTSVCKRLTYLFRSAFKRFLKKLHLKLRYWLIFLLYFFRTPNNFGRLVWILGITIVTPWRNSCIFSRIVVMILHQILLWYKSTNILVKAAWSFSRNEDKKKCKKRLTNRCVEISVVHKFMQLKPFTILRG